MARPFFDDDDSSADDADIEVHSNAVHEAFIKYGVKLKSASTWAKGLLVLGGATLAGAGQFIPDAKIGPLVGWVGVFLAFCGGAWTLFVDESAPEMLLNAHKAIELAKRTKAQLSIQEAEKQEMEDSVDQSSMLYSTQSIIREYVEREAASGPTDLSKSIQNLINLVRRQLHYLMNLRGGEYWTLAIYRHVSAADGLPERLVYVAGDRSERQDEERPHREWGIGEGVAGHCFKTARELIIEDANDRDNAGWIYVPGNLICKDDSKEFVSFAAIPITVPYLNHPWGVLVVTSDDLGRFETDGDGHGTDEIEPMRMLAGMVALFTTVTHLTSSLPRSRRDDKPDATDSAAGKA